MNVVAIIITYYPNINEVKNNIKQFISHINKLIIWENTPLDELEQHKIRIPEYSEKIIYMSTGKNEGIAYPLNRSIEWAKKYQFTHILAMDQDSYWDNFDQFIKKAYFYEKKGIQAIFTPNINSSFSTNESLFEKESFITSGSLFPLSIIEKIGYFNEALFVEGVDLDYSLRVIRSGLKILVVPGANLVQKFGYPVESKKFNIKTCNYNSTRTFNIVKHHILIFRRYRNILSPDQKRMIFRGYILGRLIKVMLLEKDKCHKIYAIINGLIKGFIEPKSKYFN